MSWGLLSSFDLCHLIEGLHWWYLELNNKGRTIRWSADEYKKYAVMELLSSLVSTIYSNRFIVEIKEKKYLIQNSFDRSERKEEKKISNVYFMNDDGRSEKRIEEWYQAKTLLMMLDFVKQSYSNLCYNNRRMHLDRKNSTNLVYNSTHNL